MPTATRKAVTLLAVILVLFAWRLPRLSLDVTTPLVAYEVSSRGNTLDDQLEEPRSTFVDSNDEPSQGSSLRTTEQQPLPPFVTTLGDDHKVVFSECRPTSQVRIRMSNDGRTPWILVSLDDQGREKECGGDEYYVSYTDQTAVSDAVADPTAAALVHDLHNGTYALEFVTTPMRRTLATTRLRGRGSLTIFFQYTCGIGRLDPPAKKHWQGGGRSRLEFALADVPQPPMRTFVPPTLYNLSHYSAVFFVGDSLVRQLHGQPRRRPHTFFAGTIHTELHMGTVASPFLSFIKNRHGKELHGAVPAGAVARREESNMALLIGSAVWDLLGNHTDVNHESHLRACRVYVETLRRTYPHVTLFWKSPTALHPHRLPVRCNRNDACNHRSRYMSQARSWKLYTLQKELMEQVGVPFLDLYETTHLSAHRSVFGDGRHYVAELNELMSQFLFGLES
jgi:hypothetical protein